MSLLFPSQLSDNLEKRNNPRSWYRTVKVKSRAPVRERDALTTFAQEGHLCPYLWKSSLQLIQSSCAPWTDWNAQRGFWNRDEISPIDPTQKHFQMNDLHSPRCKTMGWGGFNYQALRRRGKHHGLLSLFTVTATPPSLSFQKPVSEPVSTEKLLPE